MLKVGLIHAPDQSYFYKNWDFEPPLWALALATYLEEALPAVQVEIIDGQLSSLENILLKVKEKKFNIVGLSPVTYFDSYKNALEIARFSKKIGSQVVLGGHHATALKKEILQNRGPYSKDYCIDAIVQYDGEKALTDYVSGKPLDKINNLVYQEKNGQIKENPVEILDLDKLPSINYGLVNLENYFDYQPNKRKYLSFVFQRGCDWKDKTGGCLFCAITNKKLRHRSPQRIGREIEQLIATYGVKEIWDVGDDFLASKDWTGEICQIVSAMNTKPEFRIFSRPCHINEKNIPPLKKMNVKIVTLGIESFDDEILQKLGKGATTKTNKEAIFLLLESHILPSISLILGSPGENKDTLRTTLDEIKKFPSEILPDLVVFPFVAFPGSPAWKLFLEKEKKYIGQDLINSEALRGWIKHFCAVSYEEILETFKKLYEFKFSKTPNILSKTFLN